MSFNLTIQNIKSSLDKLECTEQIHTDKLQLLINSDLLLTESFDNFENEKQQLIKYSKINKKVIYNKSCSFGRVYAKGGLGLQSIRKEIRHTLTTDIYVDIDIENAHPSILSQILTQNDKPFKYLNKYVSNREKYLTKVQDEYNTGRDAAKSLLIMLLYGGTFNNWGKQHTIQTTQPLKDIAKVQDEFKIISSLIEASNQEIKKELEKKEKTKNKKVFYIIVLFARN